MIKGDVATFVVSVLSRKGGVGKTASAIHIAAHLGYLGRRTLLIDGDEDEYATGWVRSEVPFDVMTTEDGIAAMDGYDAVVIDAQGGLPAEDVQALGEISNVVLVPCVPEWQSVSGMTRTAAMLVEAGVPLSRMQVLLTMDMRAGDAADEARATLEAQGLSVLTPTIRNTVAFRHAALAGVLVQRVPGVAGKMAWEEYRAATRELLEVSA